MKKLLIFICVFSSSAWANLHLAPPDFNTPSGRAIFVDFKKAEYEITYDFFRLSAIVKSRITFVAESHGRPVFDLLPEPSVVKINGEVVGATASALPGNVSVVRIANQEVSPGEHVLEVENTFRKNLLFHPIQRAVSSAFWIRDLRDRMFLEQYLPSNFEYDQYKIVMDVKVKLLGSARQDIYANGVVEKIGKNHWQIEFPDYFTVSCLYFHMTPKGRMFREDFTYRSLSGRDIPMTTYSGLSPIQARNFKKYAIEVMEELERDYGPWAHPGFIAYATLPGTGGMEHAGATQTSLAALDHEMLHSYFAKGIMPANGNSGWIDEGIAAWRDRGYKRLPDPGFKGSDLGNHSVYKRNTDSRAYVLGSAFMAYLDWRLQDMGGLKAFLKGYFAAYKHQVVNTLHFKNNLEFFSGLNLDDEFETYIWGENSLDVKNLEPANPYHQPVSDGILKQLL